MFHGCGKVSTYATAVSAVRKWTRRAKSTADTAVAQANSPVLPLHVVYHAGQPGGNSGAGGSPHFLPSSTLRLPIRWLTPPAHLLPPSALRLPPSLRPFFLVKGGVEGDAAGLEVELADELQGLLAPCSRSMPLSSHSTDNGP